MSKHVTQDDFRRFFEDRLGAADRSRIVRHLLSGCLVCRRLASEVSQVGKTPADYDAVFGNLSISARMLPGRLRAERIRAREQWVYLQKLSPSQQLLRVDNDPRFLSFGLYELILKKAEEMSRDDPPAALAAAQLAVVVLERLDPKTYREGAISEMRASALAVLGNAQRAVADYEGAAASFAEAMRLTLEQGSDSLLLAHIYSLRAFLETDLRNIALAIQVLDKARGIYEKLADRHMIGRVEIQRGLAIGCHDPELGIARLAGARMWIQVQREPRLDLCIRHSTAFFLCDIGQTREARDLLQRSARVYERFPDLSVQVRRRWLEARISRGLGDFEEAERIFRHTAETALARGLPHEHRLLMSELAAL